MSTNGYFGLNIGLHPNKTLIHNFLHVFDNWGGGAKSQNHEAQIQ